MRSIRHPAHAADTAEAAQRLPLRSEIETRYCWATESIYPDRDAWEQDYVVLSEAVAAFGPLQGTLHEGVDACLKLLKLRDDLETRIDRLCVYASLTADEDTSNGDNQALRQKSQSLAVHYHQASSWIEPELTALPFEDLQSWMDSNQELAVYRHYLENLFRQKTHILSSREEELLAIFGQMRLTPYNAYSLLSNADLTFPTIQDSDGRDVELSDAAFYLLMRVPDRRVRRDAYEGLVGTYKSVRNTAAALLNGAVQGHVANVQARGYESCLAAALDGGNIPVGVYTTLVDTVSASASLLHRYQAIRQKALKLDDGVHAYDLFAPLIAEEKKKYNYEEAVSLLVDALAPLGDDYVSVMKEGFDSRWVDVYPTRNKRSGAYSSGSYLTQPYILMNFQGTYDSVSTLAHEMGHSMHSHLSRKHQPIVYSDYDIFCAEVASTCNEILLQHYVLERITDPREKLSLLSEFLETIRGTVFRQTMFSAFEQRIHEMAEKGEALTADALSATYGEAMTSSYGPRYVHDDLVNSYWIRIPHFYYNFYVYKYATSYCAATNIARRILAGEDGAVESYLGFLEGGSSAYPVDLLAHAGVDMTQPGPVEDCMKLFASLLDETEKLVDDVLA